MTTSLSRFCTRTLQSLRKPKLLYKGAQGSSNLILVQGHPQIDCCTRTCQLILGQGHPCTRTPLSDCCMTTFRFYSSTRTLQLVRKRRLFYKGAQSSSNLIVLRRHSKQIVVQGRVNTFLYNDIVLQGRAYLIIV